MDLGQLLSSLRSGPSLGMQHSVPQAFGTADLPLISRPQPFGASLYSPPTQRSLGSLLTAALESPWSTTSMYRQPQSFAAPPAPIPGIGASSGALSAPGVPAQGGSLSGLVPQSAWGGSADAASTASVGEGGSTPPGAAVPASVSFANAAQNVFSNPLAAVLSPVPAIATAILAPIAQNAFLAEQAQHEAQIPSAEFGPVGPGPDSATDPSSVGAVNGADAASDAAAAAAAVAAAVDGDGGGGGGGGGGGKIVCTAMNQAYGFGSFRQAIWLEYSATRLTKQHERGYHRIFRPLVRYAFHSGNGFVKSVVRRFLEKIMRLRTADLRAEMRGKNPHPIQRVIRRACEWVCYQSGKVV